MNPAFLAALLALLGPLAEPPAELPVSARREAGRVTADNGTVSLTADLTTGRFSVRWGNHASVNAAAGAIRLSDGRERTTVGYARHLCDAGDVTTVRDAFGAGVRLTVRHRQDGEPELRQTFTVYAGRPEAYVQLEATGYAPLASNHIAPLVVERGTGGIDLESGDPLQVLFVPFDNDMFVRYHSQNWGPEADSFEVTAFYDNVSRGGLVVGSVDHDLWKTGFAVRDRGPRRVGGLRVYAGATGYWSHDKEPHGTVTGTTVRSPRVFLGWFPDWRDGMERFGKANALTRPALRWDGGVPFGWNSWAAHKTGLNADHARAATAFFAEPGFSSAFRGYGPNFVNLDAFWDFLKPDDLTDFVRRSHQAGLKVGIYWTPFAAWGDDLNVAVEGAGGKITYRDIALKDSRGEPLPRVDNGWPLDPTHPGTKLRNAYHYARFVEWGFDFVKLDFMSHGAFEGVHYDKSVPTGIAAYNVGMKQIAEAFDPKRIGRPFFISLSIAPLFPHGYAHSRRMSCDAFSNIGQTEYLLNSLSYGWWAHDTLYRYNDPDHSVVYRTSGEGPVTLNEGTSRLTASVVAGGMLLNGDDLTDAAARERVRALFTRPEVIALARKGRTFRPVDGDTGSASTDTFTLYAPEEKALYVAVFNFDGGRAKTKALAFPRLGLDPAARYRFRDLWTGQEGVIRGGYTVSLASAACALLRFKRE
jgi:alpha-galactosidase